MYEFLSMNLYILIVYEKLYEFVCKNSYILICICKITFSYTNQYIRIYTYKSIHTKMYKHEFTY